MIFIYGLFCPIAQTIRYVGKSGNPDKRLRHHLCGARRAYYDHHTARWLRSLGDREPQVVILHEVIGGESWQEIERAFIASADERGWMLTNTTAGGEGLDYRDPADAARYRAKLSKSQKAIWATPERRAEARARSLAVAANPELLAKRNKAIRQAYQRPETLERHAAASRATASRPEVQAARSDKMKLAWNDPVYRGAIEAARNDPDFIAAQGQRLRNRWNDPAAREKMNSARWTPEKRRDQADRIRAYNESRSKG